MFCRNGDSRGQHVWGRISSGFVSDRGFLGPWDDRMSFLGVGINSGRVSEVHRMHAWETASVDHIRRVVPRVVK